MPHTPTHFETTATPESLEAERRRLAAPFVPSQAPLLISSEQGAREMTKIQDDLNRIREGVGAAEVRTGELVKEAEAKKAEEVKAAEEARKEAEAKATEMAALGVTTPPATETPEEKARKEAQAQYEKDVAESNAILEPLKARLDTAKQAQISNIQAQYARLRIAQQEANVRREKLQTTIGIRTGGMRYTPEHTADEYKAVVDAGLQKISELNAQENEAIGKINSAFDDKSYDIALKEYTNLKDVRTERDKKLAEIEKTQAEALADAEKNNKLFDGILKLVGAGITDNLSIVNGLRKLGVSADAKAIKDTLDLMLPENKSSADLSMDEKTLARLKETGAMPANATLFDYWKKESEAKRNPADPLLSIIRDLTIQQKNDQMAGYITFTPKDQTEYDYADAFRAAISDAPVGQQQFRGRYFSDLMKRGDLAQAREYIFKTALETTGTEQQKTIGGAADTLKALSNFKQLMRDMADSGVSTNILTGSLEDIARKLGETTNPLYVDFNSRASKILFDYRKAMTGVQFSFAEGEQYKNLFPQYTNNIGVNTQLINSMTASLSNQVDNFYKRSLGTDLYNKLASEGQMESFGITPQKITIQGQELEVGSIVENKSGIKGRVNADGTITPLP